MAFKIYLNTNDWRAKESEYHIWMQANVSGYRAEQWAILDWCKHPTEDKWHLLIPTGHSDTGEELTDDWIYKE